MSAAEQKYRKSAIVVGAAGGIGSAVVDSLRKNRWNVIGLDQKADPARQVMECDVRDPGSVTTAVKAAISSAERIDAAVYSAGIIRDRVLWKLDAPDWDAVHAVNLRGAFLFMKELIPAMRERGGGSIVLIGSINGARGKFGQAAYASSKAGLIGLAKSAARETGRFGIRVNVVEPGMVRTAMTEKLPAEVLAAAEEESLLGRLAETEDIAGTVTFLCGEGAGHITGQVIRVDGGQYL